ncbi:hypothetical protein HUT18_10290 [Streptomyces sp. NA04227]|nr:hypothetical protein HUT18_10290 [Streptomyces sp. NA04227]
MPARGLAYLRRLFAVLVLVLSDVLLVESGMLTAAVALAATAAVGSALVLCAVHAARSAPAVPRARVRTALRDRAMRTAFLSQRDPDARGRRRPRAPGGRSLVTAAA